MQEENRRWTVIAILAVSLAVYWQLTKPNRLPKEQSANEAIVVSDSHIASQQTEPGNYADPEFIKGSEITDHVLKVHHTDNSLPFTAYQFEKPLLPKARLLDFRELDGKLWFAGDTGLIYFDMDSERWFQIDKTDGLPGDTAYGIELLDDTLLLRIYNWTDKGHLSGGGGYIFNGGEFLSSKLTLISAKAGGQKLPKPQNLTGSLTDVLLRRGEHWVTVRGKHISRDEGFAGGGVFVASEADNSYVEYTTEDGLASAYCNALTTTEDGTVWVAHWHEEVGLSYFSESATRWQTVEKSRNGIELGGVSVFAKGRFVFIAQQGGGLVVYDSQTQLAHQLTESDGLPGYIVSDIQLGSNNSIWVSAYGYGRGGQSATGLIKLNYNEINRFFDTLH